MVLKPWLVWDLQAQTPELTLLFQIKDTWGRDINIICFSSLLCRKGITFCSKDLRIDSQVFNTMLNTKLVLGKYFYLFSFLKGVQFNMQINDTQVHQYRMGRNNSLKFHGSSIR